MSSSPLILITNDDGIGSQGLRHLVRWASGFGRLCVVAPHGPQSGAGHSITVGETLRLDATDLFGQNIESYACSGTPSDCVKLAKSHILEKRPPDLILSGVNHGDNSSISILYSGTMSAAVEGAIGGTPSVGFSLCDYEPNAPMEHIEHWLKVIIQKSLKPGFPKHVALNVNFPGYDPEKPLRGVRMCRQARARWQESFEKRIDPHGRDYFWMQGDFEEDETLEKEHDRQALREGFVSVVPCKYDMTCYETLHKLGKQWSLKPL